MLVLTRKAGETILIGEDIEVTVLTIKGNQARIGVRAPQHINIVREEIAGTPRKPKKEGNAQ